MTGVVWQPTAGPGIRPTVETWTARLSGVVLMATRTANGWQGSVRWPGDAVGLTIYSDTLPTRVEAQLWAEREAAQ